MTEHPTPAVRDCLTDQNAEDIIDTASYGGITYWATQPTAADFASRPEGKTWTIVDGYDEDDRQVFHLDADDVRRAYSRLLDLDQRFVNRTIHGYIVDSYRDRTVEDGIDCGHIDADAADVIVQLACFGEVVYG